MIMSVFMCACLRDETCAWKRKGNFVHNHELNTTRQLIFASALETTFTTVKRSSFNFISVLIKRPRDRLV